MSADVLTAGYGKPGYCKICAWSHYGELQSRIEQKWKTPDIQHWAKQFEFEFNRKTLYEHKKHTVAPGDRVVALAEQTRAAATQKRSNRDVVAAIRDIGFANIEMNPGSVRVSDTLKAAGILEAGKTGPTNILVLMAQAMTRNQVIVDGDYKEID